MPAKRQMRADLMGLAAVQAHLYARELAAIFRAEILGHDLFCARAGGRKDAHPRLGGILFQIRRQKRRRARKRMAADRFIDFFRAAQAEGIRKRLFRRRIFGKADEPARVSIEAVDEAGALLFMQDVKERLRIDPRVFIGDEKVFVFVHGIVKREPLFPRRRIISDFVTRKEENVLPRLFSVDAYLLFP